MVTRSRPAAKYKIAPEVKKAGDLVGHHGDQADLRYGRWTKQERLAFLVGLRKFGKSKWKEISGLIPTR